ncbi:RagB/SusD family nutrient uptake outer membrane protein [Ilyomonas limi]|uniref:RagB/SusD family nutrient uptake outer membrane protein n=1 Tax=Ilyomonas limi TaxID=2575867 RepID=A0A4U3KZZ6_9BACT|nr:RagB/SusD family nutrient uptake outer membrane protein [Ilyomonas limi]TKK67414.1 RagB/SusD family nutrient uptake outer membrane protein [Ilyomonas limi]
MKNTKHIPHILLFMLLFGLGSCTKFLDENPTGSLTPSSSVTSPEIARAFANSAYSELTTLDQGSGGYGGNTAELMEFMSGKAFGNAQTESFRFYNLTYDAQSFYIDTWWQGLFYGVANCNLALQKIADIPMDTATKANLLAEVHTLRAFYYFYLVRMYGDVPIITDVVSDLNNVNPQRNPVKDVYDQVIIPDLLTAEASTLPWQDNTGKVSMGAVKSLLADVYLTYAGYPVQGGDQYYAESAKRSKEVMDNGGFILFPEYTDMIQPANKNKGEFIWQVQFAAGLSDNDLTAKALPQYQDIAVYSDEFGGLVPTTQFVKSYPDGDKRVQERQFYYTKYPRNGTTTDTVVLGGYYIYKWFDVSAVTNTAHSDLNYTIYRLADVMLMYAEASNRAEGSPNATAIAAVNAIRQRAKLPPISAMSQDEFEKEVWTQRYLELAYEGKIWFDMLRTRKVRNDITKQFDDFVGHTTVWGKTFTQNQLLFPIPLREINNNPNLVQNPGF